MLRTALRQAAVRSCPWLVPSASIGMPIVAVNRRGKAHCGSVKSVVRSNLGHRILRVAASFGRIGDPPGGGPPLPAGVNTPPPSPRAGEVGPPLLGGFRDS